MADSAGMEILTAEASSGMGGSYLRWPISQSQGWPPSRSDHSGYQ